MKRRQLRRTSGFTAAVLLSALSLFRQQPLDTPCGVGPQPRASHDLYCIELAPIPALEGAAGTFELGRYPSPFGVNVSRDGRQTYAPVVRIHGLPAPGAFTPGARVWVVWMTTQLLDPTRKLGVVGNGTFQLPRIDWPKFLILVTAESSANVTQPSGRPALRGLSPSSRLQPPDMTQFIYGAAPAAAPPHMHGGAGGWLHPPMPPGLAMMPAEMLLPPPAATPFLPADTGSIPNARPSEVVRLHNGDTLVLTAMPVRRTVRGRSFIGYGYNGQVPGPLLRAEQGSTVYIRYRNAIDWPTTVHWHGVRLDNRSDGADGMTQEAVPPGGSFDYTVHLPDAGLYWYHPHRRDDVLRDLGLAGNILVVSAQPSLRPVSREEVLMLDDMEMVDSGGGPMPYGRERATHALMGRFGNVMLINGRSDWSLDLSRGEVVRFLLTNASNSRTFNVSFGGARIKLLGSDLGSYERPEWVESVVIAPAERYLVDVRFGSAGAVAIENRVQAIDHVYGKFFQEVDTLGMIRVGAQAAAPDYRRQFELIRENRVMGAELARARKAFLKPPDRELVIRMEAPDLPFVVGRFLAFDSVYFHPVEWGRTMPMMNWNSTTSEVHWILEEPSTGRKNMNIHWEFKTGSLVKIRIANLRETLHAMQHPIHFHGQRFLVLSQNGVANTNLAWKDTFLLPAGGSADILLDASNPGLWMAHCHIAEHLESGMMMGFSIH